MSYGGSGYSALAQVLARSQTGGGMRRLHRFLLVIDNFDIDVPTRASKKSVKMISEIGMLLSVMLKPMGALVRKYS